jgi:RNA polymerase sigma-70 factor, ECF subfamily
VDAADPAPQTDAPADIDAQLVAGLRRGEEGAFAELVGRYHLRLLRLAATFLSSRETAEDVAQETWLAVLAGIDGFQGRSAFRSWLFSICANKARSSGQRDLRTVPVDPGALRIDPTDARDFAEDGSWASPPEEWIDMQDRLAADAALVVLARQAIEALPASQRQVVTLRDIEGLTAQEVCAVLAITTSNQRVLLHRGRAALRRALDQAARS